MTKKIFIVEDENDLMEFYIDALETSGYEIVGWSMNGIEAVEKFAGLAEKPDVVIMDHRLPGQSGVEAARQILKIDPAAKFIFASADASIEPDARTLGIASFKRKPFSLERLLNNIDKATNGKVHQKTE